LYDKYSLPPNVIGFIAPRNIKLSANPSVNRSGFAFANIGTRLVIFTVCAAATSSVFLNTGAARSANGNARSGFANVNDGCIA
jgi:hypothetical protein